MTALDRNDRIPDDAPQNKVKLEWITPKISLMGGGETYGTKAEKPPKEYFPSVGPS
jgi:hypothetical protein